MESFFDKLPPGSMVYKRKDSTYAVRWKSNKYGASWISEDGDIPEKALDKLLKTIGTQNSTNNSSIS